MFNPKFSFLAIAITAFLYTPTPESNVDKSDIKKKLSKVVVKEGELANNVKVDGKTYDVTYTIDQDYQKFLDKLLRRHYSDYAVAVVVDNESGNILGIGSYSRKEKRKVQDLAFQTTHPSASLIKIVSFANLVENSEYKMNSDIVYQGRGTTLYKYQLSDKYRYPRRTTLKKAFAYSNNPAIAKATIEHTNANDFIKTAHLFGFNHNVTNFINLPKAVIPYPSSQYNYAELSSGFNNEAFTNPIHAVYLPFLVANNGFQRKIKLVDKIVGGDGVVHHGIEKINSPSPALKDSTVTQLREAMKQVVERGTATRLKRKLRRKVKSELEIGGKTGTLTGGNPYGRRDWFVGYAIPKDNSSKGISFAVMHINQEKWFVRSTFIAKNIIDYYYQQRKKDKERVALK